MELRSRSGSGLLAVSKDSGLTWTKQAGSRGLVDYAELSEYIQPEG